MNRKDVLREYHLIKGHLHQPDGLHESIRWRNGDAALIPAAAMHGKWQLVGGDVVKGKKPRASMKEKGNKRKAGEQLSSKRVVIPIRDS